MRSYQQLQSIAIDPNGSGRDLPAVFAACCLNNNNNPTPLQICLDWTIMYKTMICPVATSRIISKGFITMIQKYNDGLFSDELAQQTANSIIDEAIQELTQLEKKNKLAPVTPIKRGLLLLCVHFWFFCYAHSHQTKIIIYIYFYIK